MATPAGDRALLRARRRRRLHAHDDLKRLFDRGLFSPQAIAIQVAGIVLLIVLVLIDWPSVIDKLRAFWAARRGRPAPAPIRQDAY